jgi:ABC-type uncharacterized transport system ATPase subunit
MHQVEEMCQRILLMDRGRRGLYGSLDEIFVRTVGREIEEGDLGSPEERVP